MTASPELIVLDVGHGNCSILKVNDTVAVIDSPNGGILLEALESLAIKHVDFVIVSHADEDHVAGITSLLLDPRISVGQVFVNSDSVKRTQAWLHFRIAVRDQGGGVKISSVTTSDPGKIEVGAAEVHFLYPTPEVSLGGVGGQDLSGRPLDANSMSVVLRIDYLGRKVALLAGDMSVVAYQNIKESNADLQAEVLVYPHHGGKPGSADAAAFTSSLMTDVNPSVVLFSIGRGKHDTPKPEIIETIKKSGVNTHIACTQLSRRCHNGEMQARRSSLSALPASGKRAHACCGGSFTIPLTPPAIDIQTVFGAHRIFVREEVSTPLCSRR